MGEAPENLLRHLAVRGALADMEGSGTAARMAAVFGVINMMGGSTGGPLHPLASEARLARRETREPKRDRRAAREAASAADSSKERHRDRGRDAQSQSSRRDSANKSRSPLRRRSQSSVPDGARQERSPSRGREKKRSLAAALASFDESRKSQQRLVGDRSQLRQQATSSQAAAASAAPKAKAKGINKKQLAEAEDDKRFLQGLICDFGAPQDWLGEVASFAMIAKKAGLSLEGLQGKYNQELGALRILLKDRMRPIEKLHASPDAQWVRGFHGTTVRGVLGILANGFLQGLPWDLGGAGTDGVYGIVTLHPTDAPSIENLLKKAKGHTKNKCNAIFEFVAHGLHKPIKSGGVDEDQKHAKLGYIVHNKSDHRWCMNPAYLRVEAIILFKHALAGAASELEGNSLW